MLKGILAIAGQPGLYKLIAETKSHLIVESIETGKRMPAYTTAKISTLEDIAIFTEDDDVPLKNILKIISEKEAGGRSVDHKSSADKLRAYFGEVLPEYDRDRVYVSDIKKIIHWYNILQENNLLDFSEDENEKEQETVPDEEVSSPEQ